MTLSRSNDDDDNDDGVEDEDDEDDCNDGDDGDGVECVHFSQICLKHISNLMFIFLAESRVFTFLNLPL